jgi:hypothetical protein
MAATRPAPGGATAPTIAPPAAVAAAIAPGTVGELVIHVEPWATVSVNGRSVGQTPYRAKLPAGSYRVRIQNDDVERDETITVTVSPGAPVTIRRAW